MKSLCLFSFATLALTLAGCAGMSTPVTDSRPVNPRRHYKDFSRYEHRVPYDAKVVVVRDRNPFGSPAKANVRVDTDAMAGLGPAERVTFYVGPGDHRLSVEPAFHIGSTPAGRTFHFKPNQTAYFRVVTSINSFDLQPASTAQSNLLVGTRHK